MDKPESKLKQALGVLGFLLIFAVCIVVGLYTMGPVP